MRDSHPIPHVKDVLTKVGQWTHWVKLDLKSGFWQVPLDASSTQYTGVCVPDDLFVWSRLPFGVRNGPPAFQRNMQQALRQAGLGDMVGCFIDDLAIGGKSHQEAAQNAGKLFAMLED